MAPRAGGSVIVYEKHDRTEPPAGRVRARVRRRLPRPHRRTLEVDADRAQGDARWLARTGRSSSAAKRRSSSISAAATAAISIGSALPGRPRPPRHRHPAGRDPLRPQTRQPARPREPEVRGPRRARTAGEARPAALGRGDPLLPPAAVLRPGEGPPAAHHAGVHRPRPPVARARRPVRGPDRQPRLLEVHPEVVPFFFDFHERIGRWPDAPRGRTRREIIALQKKLPVFRGHGTAKPDLSEDEAAALGRIAAAADLRRRPPLARSRPTGVNSIHRTANDRPHLDPPLGPQPRAGSSRSRARSPSTAWPMPWPDSTIGSSAAGRGIPNWPGCRPRAARRAFGWR